jgi:DNA-binding transcriptional ArsR family regulator
MKPDTRRALRSHMVLSDADRIKGYVHPVRMAILQMLAVEPRTVTSIARQMKVHSANITHHFKRLERLGLVRVVETRDTGRNLERHYAAVARSFLVRPKGRGAANRQALALSILRDNLSVAIERVRTGARTDETLALLGSARLRAGDLRLFTRRLQALVAQFKKADRGDGLPFSLNISLYPDDANMARSGATRVEIK